MKSTPTAPRLWARRCGCRSSPTRLDTGSTASMPKPRRLPGELPCARSNPPAPSPRSTTSPGPSASGSNPIPAPTRSISRLASVRLSWKPRSRESRPHRGSFFRNNHQRCQRSGLIQEPEAANISSAGGLYFLNIVAPLASRNHMTSERDNPNAVCPLYHHAVELVGRRWTGAILMVLLQGASRFTDIVHAVPGLSDRLLSERLKELESEGIVTRIVHPEMPVRIEYQLTGKGRDLSGVAEAVTEWATRWLSYDDESR